jgi:OOP family OmpA-OmpF porin
MNTNYHIKYLGFVTLLVLSQISTAMPLSKDTTGSMDHPLFSRYPGSLIYNYNATEFDEYKFVTGPVKNEAVPLLPIEGKYTTIVYEYPETLSTLQIFKNFEEAFKKAGAKVVLSCNQTTCGDFLPKYFLDGQGSDAKTSRYLGTDLYNTGKGADYRFWSGIIDRNGAKTYITFMVRNDSSISVSGFLDVIEPKAMETGLIKLNLQSMDSSLKNHGKVVLDGLFFDTDKATIKAESKDTLKALSDYLNANPNVNAYVVGHTDNSGDYKHNVVLSQQRADAVVQALIKEYKLTANRLFAVGIGPVSPAASNNTEADKAKNRRVELVLK